MAIYKKDYTQVQDADEVSLYTPPANLKMSVTQFESNPQVQEDAEKYFSWVAKQFPTVGGAQGYEDISESIRDEDMRLTDLLTRGLLDEEMPEDVKQSYQRLRDTWDNKTEIKGWKEGLEATMDYGIDIVSDPLNLLGLVFTGGSSVAAKETVKSGVKATLKKLATSESTSAAATRGAIAGSAWTGLDNYARQNVEINAGIRDAVSGTEVALMTGAGAVLGGGLGAAISSLSGGLTKNARRIEDLKEEVSTPKLKSKEDDLEAPSEEKLIEVEEKAPRQLGLFDTEEPEQLPTQTNLFDDLVEDLGGGKVTKEEVQDLVEETTANTEPKKIKNKLLFELGRIANSFGATIAFKPASLLDSYTSYSGSAKELQKKFRYDLGRNIWGEREYDQQDFYEVMKEISGEYYTKVKLAMEPIQTNVKGDLTIPVNNELMRALRGETADNENINIIAGFLRRDVLDKLGKELSDAGYIDEPIEGYVPRFWNRKAIENNPEEFARKLIEAEEAEDLTEAEAIITQMLDIENQIGEGSVAGNSFFAKRAFTKLKDNDFEEFLEGDINKVLINYSFQTAKQLAKKQVFGVKNLNEFKKRWLNPIAAEMADAGKTLSKKDRDRITNLYRTATGEDVKRWEGTFSGVVDFYSTANRLAYLPLATLSSVTEIFINVQKAGVVNTIKGFSQASKAGRQTIQTNLIDFLKKNHDLKEPEIWRELNKFSIAVDTAAGDVAERLSGDTLNSNFSRSVNNGFFRFTMLDQWTKFVQLTSFITGKELIVENLKKISARGNLEDSGRTKAMRDELKELGVDINKGLQWIARGAKEDDEFYTAVQRGASRYTNEVILTPTPESGLKPTLLSNPKTSILFQFMGYPAAFSNTILKNAATKMMRDPVGNVPKTLAAGLIMTETARWTNWARSHGESEKFKSEEEIYVEAVKRWGGNGLIADMMARANKSAEIYQSQTAYVSSMLGPVGQDIYKIIKRDSPIRFLGEKVPFYGAINTISPEAKKDYDTFIRDLDSQMRDYTVPERPPRRFEFKKGGEVDIPQASPEPDERIDKMTGLPYNVQAGTAFMDEEDPLRRMGFGKGGEVDPLVRLGLHEGSKVTTKGRKVYEDEKGKYSERTETIQLDNGDWVNYPTIDKKGNKIPERLFKKLVESQLTKDGAVDFITGETLPTYKDMDTAIKAAKSRSDSLLKDK